MRSPTIVIPEYGSLHRDGSMLVIDLGQCAAHLRMRRLSVTNRYLSFINNASRSAMVGVNYCK